MPQPEAESDDARLRFDVFVSYSSQDAKLAETIAHRLRTAGLRVWFDKWLIKPGDDIASKIENGLSASRTQVLLVSESALKSEWVSLERYTVMFRDPTNRDRRLIPLRLDDAKWPDVLRRLRYIDFRSPKPQQFKELIQACRPYFRLRVEGSIAIIRFQRSVGDGEYESEELQSDFDRMHRDIEEIQPTGLVIDFAGGQFYGSFVMGGPLGLVNRMRESSRPVVFTGVSPTVRELLDLTGVLKSNFAALAPSVSEAITLAGGKSE